MTSTFPDISISTDRLVLRPFEEEDVPHLADTAADEAVRTWVGAASADFPGPGATLAEVGDWALRGARERRERGSGVAFAVVEFMTGRLVGFVEVRNADWRCRTAEAVFAIGPWARGEGYAPEAVLAVAQWLFEDQKFERLELRTAAGNTSAQQVAQKIGCISEGVLRSAALVRAAGEGDGGTTRSDVILWSLLPEDLDGLHEAVALDGSGRAQFGMWD